VTADRNRIPGLTRDYRAWVPAISVAAVAVVTVVLAAILTPCARNACVAAVAGLEFPIGALAFKEVAARYRWGIATAAVFASAGGAITLAVVTCRDAGVTRRHARTLVAMAVMGIVVFKLLPSFEAFALGPLFLRPTVYASFPVALRIGTAIDIVAVATMVTVVLAVSLLIQRVLTAAVHPRAEGSAGDSAGRILIVVRDIKRLRLLLMASALVLALGAVEVGSLYAWGGAIVSASERPMIRTVDTGSRTITRAADSSLVAKFHKAGEDLPSTTSGIAGAFYSLLLASMFLPAFALVRLKLRDLALNECPETFTEIERSKWLADHDLEASIPRQITAALAVLAPILVGGPGSELLKNLTA
jgi:hypothetical protein